MNLFEGRKLPTSVEASTEPSDLLIAAKKALRHMCKAGCPGVDELDEAITSTIRNGEVTLSPTDEQTREALKLCYRLFQTFVPSDQGWNAMQTKAKLAVIKALAANESKS